MDNTNKPETEQDGIRAEALRRLKVRQLFKGQPAPTPDSSQSQSSTPPTTSELTSRNNVVAHHVSEVPGQLNES